MALNLRDPNSYTQAELLGNGAYQDEESGLWYRPGEDGGRERVQNIDDFDIGMARENAIRNDANAQGYYEVGENAGGRAGLQAAISKSAEAQKRGIKTVEDYYRYTRGGDGSSFETVGGKEYYKGDGKTSNNFDMGLASPMDWTGKLTLGVITAIAGGAAMAAMGGAGAAAGAAEGATSGAASGGAAASSGAAGGATGAAGTGAATSAADFIAADAAQLAGQGLGTSQVASTLGASGVDAFAAADAAQLAGQGLGASQIGSTLGASYGAELAGLAPATAAGGAAGAIANGGATQESLVNTIQNGPAANAASNAATGATAGEAATGATAGGTAAGTAAGGATAGAPLANMTQAQIAQMIESGTVGAEGLALEQAAGIVTPAAETASGLSKFLGPISDWAENNKLLASTGVSVAGGLIKGAMSPSLDEQANAAVKARVTAEKQIADAIRANNNLSFLTLGRLKPTGKVLRKAGDLPPGIINRARAQ